MPSVSSRIAISGDAAFVVQDAFEVTSQVPNLFSLTHIKIIAPGVPHSPLAGAEITTFFAPASR